MPRKTLDIYSDDGNDQWIDQGDVTRWLKTMLKVKDDKFGTNKMTIAALLRLFDGIPYNVRLVEMRRILEKNIVLRD